MEDNKKTSRLITCHVMSRNAGSRTRAVQEIHIGSLPTFAPPLNK